MLDNRNYAEMLKALNDHLINFDVVDWSAKIEFNNGPDPDRSGTWLRQQIVWGNPVTLGQSTGNYREWGLYKVHVMHPLGQGDVEPTLVAGRLCTWFNRGSILTGSDVPVKVEKSYKGTPFKDGAWWATPVTIEFWAYSPFGS